MSAEEDMPVVNEWRGCWDRLDDRCPVSVSLRERIDVWESVCEEEERREERVAGAGEEKNCAEGVPWEGFLPFNQHSTLLCIEARGGEEAG